MLNKIANKFIIILFTLFISVWIISTNISIKAEHELKTEYSSDKIYTDFSIDEEFDDSSVIVVMKKEVSQVNKEYDNSLFGDFLIESIVDLTYIPGGITENTKINKEEFTQILEIKLPIHSKQNVLDVIKKLENVDEILSACPNYIESNAEQFSLSSVSSFESYRYAALWAFHSAYGIQAEKAWNYTTGDDSIRVGIIDSGLDYHTDLSANTSADGGDFVNMDSVNVHNPGLLRADPIGHGTHVSGIIGATGTDPDGVIGTAWNVELVPLQVSVWDTTEHEWVFNVDSVIRAIHWASYNDIDIINYSGGGNNYVFRLKSAISNFDGLFVCSAGNDDQDNDTINHYPSNYDLPNLISVGAIKSNGNRPTVDDWGYRELADGSRKPRGSNYGATTVDIFAPGDNILSTVPTSLVSSGYAYKSGTSMAAPFVAGVAALMLSINPNLTPQQLKATIMNNATKSPNLTDLCVCGGRLDAYRAVAAVALDTDTIGNNIKINGFINGYTPPLNMELTIPESFAQVSSTYGTPMQDVQIIGSAAFLDCSNIVSLELPNTITNIDSYAFEGCINLESVSLSNNLYAIGVGSFKNCSSLNSIEIPSSVQHIDSDAFKNCSSLYDVNILKEEVPLTNLGTSVFDNCHNNLTITVPTNRLCDYKRMSNWNAYANKIIPNTPLYNIDLDCLMSSDNINTLIEANYNKLYELNVDCGKSYTFSASSTYSTTLTIYNSNMSVVVTNNSDNTISSFLSPGVYYLDVRFTSSSDSGNILLNYYLTYPSNSTQLIYGDNNILSSVHSISNNQRHGYFYYEHTIEEGFYKFSVTTTSITNITYPVNTIQIYTDNNKTTLLNRYPINNSETAHSMENENSLYVYIPQGGTYYIDVLLNSYNYSSITFTISQLDDNEFDFSNNLLYPSYSELFTSNKYSCFEEINISHRTSWELNVVTSGHISTNIRIYLFKKEIDPGYEVGDEHYICSLVSSYDITSTNSSPIIPIIFNPGTYYIGYSFNINDVFVSFALERIINQDINMDSTLVTDPSYNGGFTLGSEVLFNNGNLLGSSITEGFTRCIYLMVEDRLLEPMSRLDYDWYSSNDNIASVTQYGTVLAYPVDNDTNVTIYAVLKTDPSVIYYKTFTILDDTSTSEIAIECNLSYSYSEENGTYQLELNSSNSPYPMISYYMWDIIVPSINPNLEVEMNNWGYITSNGTGVVIVLGNYYLNPRVYVVIYLTINN